MTGESYAFDLGAFRCLAVNDGIHMSPARSLFAAAPEDELSEVLRQNGLEPDRLVSPNTCLLVDTGRQLALVDTGAGHYIDSSGQLAPTLQAKGIRPEDVDAVILTHAHPGHIGGVTDNRGKLTFPNARYVIGREEWDFWTLAEPDLLPLEVDENCKALSLRAVREKLPPLQNRLELVEDGAEILPGIRAVVTPGHTPGHMALLLSSGSRQLLYTSDAILHPLHLEHPDWYPVHDRSQEQAAASRAQLLDWAAAEQLPLLASHFPFPSLGHVAKTDSAWRRQPLK